MLLKIRYTSSFEEAYCLKNDHFKIRFSCYKLMKLELSIVNFLFVSKQLYCSWNFLFGSHFHWNSSNNINLLCWLLQFDLPFISLGFVFVGGIHKSFFQRFLKCEVKSLYYQRSSDSPSILWNFNYPNEAEVFQPNSKSGTVSAEGVSFALFFMPPPKRSAREVKSKLYFFIAWESGCRRRLDVT